MWHFLRAASDRLGPRTKPVDLDTHIFAAVDWICRAHDASADGGVPHSYDLKRREWGSSYPETTGYIIPTLFDVARAYDRPALSERALRMARWQISIQMEDGGFQAGVIGADPLVPTIFNTGQILFGLTRAWEESGDETFYKAAIAAAKWLIDAQDSDGCWRKFPSPFTTTRVALYNTRTAFALAKAGATLGEPAFLDAAVRNIEWAKSEALPNGWLPGNCLSHHADDRALTHTLAYAIRGILEVGVLANRHDFIEVALRVATRTSDLQRNDGGLPGYISSDWRPLVRWSCVTGNSQMAINWARIAHLTDDPTPLKWASRANHFNMSLQDLRNTNLGIRGGIPGSFPLDGEYMTWRFPNWAAKFFIDALFLERHGKAAGVVGA